MTCDRGTRVPMRALRHCRLPIVVVALITVFFLPGQSHAQVAPAPRHSNNPGDGSGPSVTCTGCGPWLNDLARASARQEAAQAALERSPLAAEANALRDVLRQMPESLTLRGALSALNDPDQPPPAVARQWILEMLQRADAPCLDCRLKTIVQNDLISKGWPPTQETPVPDERQSLQSWRDTDAEIEYVTAALLSRTWPMGSLEARLIARLFANRIPVGLPDLLTEKLVAFWRSLPEYSSAMLAEPDVTASPTFIRIIAMTGIDSKSTYAHLVRLSQNERLPVHTRHEAACAAAVNTHSVLDTEGVERAIRQLSDPLISPALLRCALLVAWRVPDGRVDRALLAVLSDTRATPGRRHAALAGLKARIVGGSLGGEPNTIYVGSIAPALTSARARDVAADLEVVIERSLQAVQAVDRDNAFLLLATGFENPARGGKLLDRLLQLEVSSPEGAVALGNALSDMARNNPSVWLRIATTWQTTRPDSYRYAAQLLALLANVSNLAEGIVDLNGAEAGQLRNLLTKVFEAASAELARRQSVSSQGVQFEAPFAKADSLPQYADDWPWLVEAPRPTFELMPVGRWRDVQFLPNRIHATLGIRLGETMGAGLLPPPPQLPRKPQGSGTLYVVDQWNIELPFTDRNSLLNRIDEVARLKSANSWNSRLWDLINKNPIVSAAVALVLLAQLAFAGPAVYYLLFDPRRAVDYACKRRGKSTKAGKPSSTLLAMAGINLAELDPWYLLAFWVARRPRCVWAWARDQRVHVAEHWARNREQAEMVAYYPNVPILISQGSSREADLEVGIERYVNRRLLDARHSRFRQTRRVLFTGQGGSGKSTMSFAAAEEIARIVPGTASDDAAMPIQGGSRDPFPILIAHECFEQANTSENSRLDDFASRFVASTLLALRIALPPHVLVDAALVQDLYRLGALVPVIDHLSEAPPGVRDVVLGALSQSTMVPLCILNSRDDEPDLGHHRGVDRIELRPLDLNAARQVYLLLVESLLTHRGIDLREADSPSFYQIEQGQLWDRLYSKESGATPLLVSLVARLAVGRITREREGVMTHDPAARTVAGVGPLALASEPELVQRYVEELAWDAAPRRLNAPRDSSIARILADARLLAWCCMCDTLKPASVTRNRAMAAIAADSAAGAEERLDVLTHRVRLLRVGSSGQFDRLRFVLDPVCEFLAGIYLVENLLDPARVSDESLARITHTARQSNPHPFITVLKACLADAPEAVERLNDNERAQSVLKVVMP